MKKFTSLSFMLIAALLVFSSCSKDDDGAPALDFDLLVGTWDITESEVSMGGQSQKSDEEGSYQFNADKTFILNEYGYEDEGTYTTSGRTISLTIDEETTIYEVHELTDNKLTMFVTEKMEIMGNSIETKYTTFLVKQ